MQKAEQDAQVRESGPGRLLRRVGLAIAIGLVIAATGLVSFDTAKISTLHNRVLHLEGQLASTRVALQKTGTVDLVPIRKSLATATAQLSSDAQTIASDENTITTLQADVALIQQCVPEIQTELGDMTGTADFNTGSVYVYPAAQVSRYCSKFVNGGG